MWPKLYRGFETVQYILLYVVRAIQKWTSLNDISVPVHNLVNYSQQAVMLFTISTFICMVVAVTV